MRQPKGEIQGMAGLAILADRKFAGLERYEIGIDGFVVPYLKAGQGAPLVLVHGFGGSKDNFNRLAKHLKSHFTVYAIDMPGFGATNRVMDADYTIPTQAQRLHQIIQALGLHKPHLAGNSMGGWISGTYASMYPDNVGSVWFLAPAGMESSRKSEVLTHYYKTGESLLLAENREQFERIIELCTHKRPGMAPGFVLDALAGRAAEDRQLHLRIYQDFKQVPSDLPAKLKESGFNGPALIVWGKQDRVLHVDGAKELQDALPNSHMILMDETGHVPMMERPEQVARDYIGWRQALGF